MINDIKEFVVFFLPVLAIIAAILALMWGLAYAGLSWECGTYSDVTGKPTQVAALTCYVQHNGEWLSYEEYKATIIAREGLTK